MSLFRTVTETDNITKWTILTHISIFVNVRHILVTICGVAVRGNFFYNGFRCVHFTGTLHNTMRHKVGNSHVCHAVRNVHRSFVGTFRWLRRDIWRVTARLPRRYRASSTRTADAGSEQSRGITTMDWGRDRAGPRTAATGS